MSTSIDEAPLPDLLASMLADLEELKRNRSLEDARGAMITFLSRVIELGLRLHRDPALRASTGVQRFLQESTALLPSAIVHLHHHCSHMKSWYYGEWEHDEWVRAARERSQMEFLFDLYAGTSFEAYVPALDEEMATVDELLCRKVDVGVYIPFERTPRGMPSTHWWWWYPGEPPAETSSS
ncbi:hypothetical protein [Sorangium sp. So ce854]|uniref:hypothetical protein n=1 Tax=Sorangium sp. So ce854 TaxID=3133322 RepID=UPI003F63AF5D